VPEMRQRTSEVGTLWFRFLQRGGRHPVRGISIRGPKRKQRDVQVSSTERLPTKRKGMRHDGDRPKRVKRTATHTSRDSTPREWSWAEQAPSPNDDGGKP